jgi:NADH dehydrogenase
LLGWLLWLFVHLVYLTGFKNRAAALANWTVAFLGRGRRQRTITKQQTLARTAAPRVANASTSRTAKRPGVIHEDPQLTTTSNG